MTSTRYSQIEEIFHAALERSGPERHAFVESICGSDAVLLDEVSAMLDADDEAFSLLDRGLPDVAFEIMGPPVDLDGSREIGPYVCKQFLGEGGMGVVWLAERKDAGNLVAIKFLPHAGLSPARRERFIQEIRTLARLKHPYIARFYDSGSLPDGTPWFVMEYVDGVPLVEYCRKEVRSIEEDLRIFRKVCEAVQYAHGQAIIHCDLKPSNILVEKDGAPRLLDFGIARELENTEEPGRSRTVLRFRSPDYSAPEWVRDGTVGVCTDVYSLGIILYELLVGRLPDPARPSIAGDRIASLSKTARSDLDAVCRKAMHTDLDERYNSVEALIRDIDHYLNREPLEARPHSARYRLGKFVARNRRAVIAASAGFALVAGLSAFFTVRLAQERNAALAEAARTRRVEAFTLDLFQGGDEDAGPAEDLKVTSLLDRGVREAQGLGADPKVQVDVYWTLGNVFQNLGNYDRANSMLETALEKSKAAFGPDHEEVARNLLYLGLLRNEQGQLGEAEKLAQEALAIDQRRLSPNDPAVADAMAGLGLILQRRGRYEDSISILSDAVRRQSIPAGDKRILSYSLFYLANARYYLGQYPLAEALNRQLLEVDRQQHGDRHPDVAVELMNLANIQDKMGDLAGAERTYRQALDIFQSWYGGTHPTTADAMAYVGHELVSDGRYDEAAPLLERALSILQTAHQGRSNPRVAYAIASLSAIHLAKAEFPEAEKGYKEALEIDRAVYGEQHQFTAVALSNLGEVYLEKGDYPRAEAVFRDAIHRFSAKSGSDPVYHGTALVRLGRTLLRQKRYEEAEPQTRAGYELLAKATGGSSEWLRKGREDLAILYDALHQPEKAAKFRAEMAANQPHR
ncbi:MAG TPA: tetratricopeptide repeat protein [Bryobacteraceae bacterium]|jgi:serine/threonine-protein kinase